MHLTLLYITALTLILRGSATILSGGGGYKRCYKRREQNLFCLHPTFDILEGYDRK